MIRALATFSQSLLFAIGVAIAGEGAEAWSAGAGGLFTVRRVGDRAVVASGLSNNVAAIATELGVIVVDSHRSPRVMREIAAAMVDSLGRDDFKWLVNTHGHWDHSSGNQVFDECVRVGHERCAEYIDSDRARSRMSRWRRERELSRLSTRLKELDPLSVEAEQTRKRLTALETIAADLDDNYVPTRPTVTFRDRTTIDGGDVVAEVIYCGATHTDHDVFVFVPDENILLTGDVFCSAKAVCFAVDALAEVPTLLAVLDEILRRAPSELTVIPGHGDLLDRDDLVHLRSMVAERHRDVRPDESAARVWADGRRLDAATGVLYFDEREFHELARRFIGRGRFGDAVGALDIALARRPDSALLHDIAGEAHFLRGDTELAVAHYRRSLELDPDNRNASDMLEMIETNEELE